MSEKIKRVNVDLSGRVIGSSDGPDWIWSGLSIQDANGNELKKYIPYKKELDPSL